MNSVVVDCKQLLKTIKANRTKHRDAFEKAQVGYRAAVIEELDKWLQEARDGKKIRRTIQLPEPRDHTSDYDRVIAMLEMSVPSNVSIEDHEFEQYVLDKWSWSEEFTATNSSYRG